jgi:hypothetical protein
MVTRAPQATLLPTIVVTPDDAPKPKPETVKAGGAAGIAAGGALALASEVAEWGGAIRNGARIAATAAGEFFGTPAGKIATAVVEGIAEAPMVLASGILVATTVPAGYAPVAKKLGEMDYSFDWEQGLLSFKDGAGHPLFTAHPDENGVFRTSTGRTFARSDERGRLTFEPWVLQAAAAGDIVFTKIEDMGNTAPPDGGSHPGGQEKDRSGSSNPPPKGGVSKETQKLWADAWAKAAGRPPSE